MICLITGGLQQQQDDLTANVSVAHTDMGGEPRGGNGATLLNSDIQHSARCLPLLLTRICKDKVMEFDDVERQHRIYSTIAGTTQEAWGGGWCFDVIIYSSLREVLAVDVLSEAASALGLEA